MAKKKVTKNLAGGKSRTSAARRKTITKEIAEKYLKDSRSVWCTSPRVDLSIFTDLDDEAAKVLGKSKGDLKLGVTTLSDASAKAFASFPHKLGLPFLRTLSDGAAKSLEKLDGDGRLEVNDGFCKTMKQLKQYCRTWHGLLQYRGWKLTETKVNWGDMPEKASELLESAFDYGRDIDLDDVEITRLSLTAPKGGKQHEYFYGIFSSCDTPFGWWYIVNDKAIVAEDEE